MRVINLVHFYLHENKNMLLKKLQLIIALFLPIVIFNSHSILISIMLFLLIMWVIYPFLFKLIALYIVVSQLIYLHIKEHWGTHHISSRIEVIFESPLYEMQEYLNSYINYYDILLFLYLTIILILILKKRFTSQVVTSFKYKSFLFFPFMTLLLYQMLSTTPFNLIEKVYTAKVRDNILQSRLSNIENITPIKTLIKNSQYDKIIIIIGESSSKNHMQIYNYQEKTTPFLNTLQPYIYNAISPVNITRYSIPIILSDATVDNWKTFFTSASIVTTMKQAGYYTYWISNQRARGDNDSFTTSIAHEANEVHFLNQNSKNYSNKDAVILKKLQHIQKHSKKKEVYFIHIMGSHNKYNSRYEKGIQLKEPSSIIDEYNNSIHYTDYIISKIYDLFKPHDKFLLVYLSDHGEVVSERDHGHGFNPSFKNEYEVPFLISSSIQNSYLDKINNSKVINLESFPSILINILNNNGRMPVSYKTEVISLSPNNILNYTTLKKY